MTNPTDTNQVSKDELDEILKKGYRYEGHEFVIDTPYLKQAIQSLIRTEKLKLLDRLDSLPSVYPVMIDGEYTHVEAIYKSAIEAERNKLKESSNV